MSGEFVHRAGAAVSMAAAVVWLGCWTAGWRRARRTRRRIGALLPAERTRPEHRPGPRCPRWMLRYAARVRQWALPACALITGIVLAGGITGCLLGALGAYGLWKWQRGRARDRATADDHSAGQLPLAADLLAACVSAGAGPREAAEAVGESLGGPVGERLARTAAELRLGSEPARAWGRFAEIPGAAGLARCLEQAGSSGAPAAGPVSRLAAGLRAERARSAAARAQRAQVLITAPVGLCFLPAFLAIGVAPVVIGLASGLLNGA
ncbi:type II secretion system F family protein [Streptomyces formicae]|uniref:Type II secretion system F family protein n=1 Tax=Streptomyces formicae TaxID=1616117 RepID=A0ABY3WD53_9ACTN|nr:type II secretion system F family protein [Streptomyces formicae]UNM10487.1 type II secretion system F family protein [Streptomyces formicae]